MTNLKIELTDSDLEKAMHAAILNSLTDIGREQVVEHAIKYLTTADTQYNAKAVSPLKQAIQNAAHKVAREILEKQLNDDEKFKSELSSLYAEVIDKLFGGENREKLLSRMTDSLSDALYRERY